MTVIKPRSRVIYFRVTDDEFNELNRVCESHGARSLSDLARLAMRRMLGVDDGPDHPVSARLEKIDHALGEMHAALSELTSKLDGRRRSAEE